MQLDLLSSQPLPTPSGSAWFSTPDGARENRPLGQRPAKLWKLGAHSLPTSPQEKVWAEIALGPEPRGRGAEGRVRLLPFSVQPHGALLQGHTEASPLEP